MTKFFEKYGIIWKSIYSKDQAKFVYDFYTLKNWCPLYPLFDKKLENIDDKN